jgi:DNA-binding PadR family transcriptional regulator
MPTDSPLGEFEVIVLMAILHLTHAGDDAFGSVVRDEIEARSGRQVSRGSIYITLDRLEDKGLLVSKPGATTADRQGRPKRLFRVTPAGRKAVKVSVATVTRMHAGLELVLGDLP